jgi:7,8-dihydropterin-6-yl-methyl-4-(beta-D-ribofuranosyl)aminobenzene 5'-phosphate synthase
MKIVTLIENLVYTRGLIAEHGFSVYIDIGNKKILFDTGQSGAFISNAEKLGIDITDIDAVIISHGHYDHIGGLSEFLNKNKKSKIYLKSTTLTPKYHNNTFIGTTIDLKKLGDRVEYVEDVTEIDGGLFIIPTIPVIDTLDTSFSNFYIQKEDHREDDQFQDELFIAITKNSKLSIISSCSHRGITNIVREAVREFKMPVYLILGGFHLSKCKEEQLDAVISYLKEINPEYLGISHCTGVEKHTQFTIEFPGKTFYNSTGNSIEIL